MASFNHVLYWLLANSLGGKNRVKILNGLFKKPQNANELSENLKIDYKTIRFHLNILLKNDCIKVVGSGYGRTYFISETLMNYRAEYEKICHDLKKIQYSKN